MWEIPNFASWGFFTGWWESELEWFRPFKPYTKLNKNILQVINIKVNVIMNCLYKVYDVKIFVGGGEGEILSEINFTISVTKNWTWFDNEYCLCQDSSSLFCGMSLRLMLICKGNLTISCSRKYWWLLLLLN